MAHYTRKRGQSAYEESNVDAFVKRTVEWQTNCSFTHSTDSSSPTLSSISSSTKAVLIVGKAEALSEHPIIKADPALSGTLAICGVGQTASTFVGATRVILGVIPSYAARTNHPGRPDVLQSMVKAAIGECGGAQSGNKLTVLATITSEDDAVAYASHIARGSLAPFTAQNSAAEGDYTAAAPPVQLQVMFQGPLGSGHAGAFQAGKYAVIAKYVQVAMRLVEAPTNLVDTTTFAEIIHKMAAAVGGNNVTTSEIAGEDLRERGYGGIYGVGKAAEFPPRLVTLHYRPAETKKTATSKKIGLVGKGLVYDAGGLSVKTPTPFMCGMKRDMGGAGGVLAGFLAAVALESHHEIAATFCLAENSIGPRSFRNDDILRLKSGKTVEINNTDAEGRLVLADGVYHCGALIPGFTPDCIINMATLTNAQMIGVGRKHGGLYCNSEAWERRCLAAAAASGDPVFPMVYAPEYHAPEFASKIADMKNMMAVANNAASACAGYFVEANLPAEYKGGFAHFDIVGPTTNEHGATGFGAAFLAKFLTQDHPVSFTQTKGATLHSKM